MAKILSLVSTLQYQPTDASRPTPVPIAVSSLPYTQCSLQELVFAAPAANVPLSEGTGTAPKFVYIEVVSGSVSITPSNSGANGLVLTANPTPVVGEWAAGILLLTYGALAALYLTCSAPAQVRVWFFQ